MKCVKSLGAYDEDGNLRDKPVLAIGPVMEKGEGDDLPNGLNHANYIDKKGYYAIDRFFSDCEGVFKALSKVVIGVLSPHITTEVDCESLFSMAGHQNHPNRNRLAAEGYERMVMAKHRMSRIYCCPEKVKREFIERFKKNAWSNEQDRDDIEFWEQQKLEYLEENPTHKDLFEEDENESDEDGEDVGDMRGEEGGFCVQQ